MEGKEIIRELINEGQTFTTIAASLKVTEASVRRWQKGSTPCSVAVTKFLADMIEKKA